MIDRALFACPCCGENQMQESALAMLDEAQEYADIRFEITSGYRCWDHNKDERGQDNSAHLEGYAADILAETSYERYKIIDGLLAAGFERVGIGEEYIHVDNDPSKPQEVVWIDE